MRSYYGWTITKNDECKAYPWNIYDESGKYICSCATLKEAKASIKDVITLEKSKRFDN